MSTPPPKEKSALSSAQVRVLSREVVYENFVKLEKVQVERTTYDGRQTQHFERHLMSTKGHSVCGLLYCPQESAFVMVEQFRLVYHLYANQGDQVEIVAGIIEPGEDVEATLRREAVEEAGCKIGRVIKMLEAFSSPGAFTEFSTVYLAEVTALPSHGALQGVDSEHEDIRVHIIPEKEAFEMMEQGGFQDYKTIAALQWFFLHRDSVRKAWV